MMEKTGTPAKPAKVRNYAIDFWRVWCTIAVAMMHFGWASLVDGDYSWAKDMFTLTNGDYPPFLYGGYLLEFFLLTGGYFMVASYRSKQRKGLTANIPASTQAWQYTGGRFKLFYPVLLFGSIFGVVFNCIAKNLNLKQWFYAICLNAWEFTGLDQLGGGMTPDHGHNFVRFSDETYNWARNWNVNFPLWYVGGIIIAGLFLYYLLAQDEGKFKTLWAPLFVTVFLGYWGYNDVGIFADRSQTFFGISDNIFWCLGGMSMGIMLYYLVEFLQQKEFGKKAVIFLTVLNVICTVFVIYTSIFNTFADMNPESASYNEMIYTPAFACIIVCSMLNKDKVTKLFNISILGKLGEFSLYWFAMHFPTAHMMSYLSKGILSGVSNSFVAMTAIYLCLVTVLGLINQFLCKKVMGPVMERFVSTNKERNPAPANSGTK